MKKRKVVKKKKGKRARPAIQQTKVVQGEKKKKKKKQKGWGRKINQKFSCLEGGEEEEAIPRKLTEEEEIAQLESEGWVNTSKIRGPPTRLAPKPPPKQDKMNAGKAETWSKVTSERNWAADVDLSPQVARKEEQKEPEITAPAEVTAKYEVGSVLGKGPFSVVFAGKSKGSGEEVALKLHTKDIARGMDFKSVQSVYEAVKGKSDKLASLVEAISFADGVCFVLKKRKGEILKSLCDSGKPFTEKDAAAIVKDLVEAVKVLHDNSIVHFDITTENLLFRSEGGVSLEGFSLCRKVSDEETTPLAGGTIQFQASEVIFNQPMSMAADVWSVGVVAFVLLTGVFPFAETHPVKLKLSIKKNVYTIPDHVSANAKDFLQTLLASDPEQRPSCEKILAMDFLKNPSDTVVPDFIQKISAMIR